MSKPLNIAALLDRDVFMVVEQYSAQSVLIQETTIGDCHQVSADPFIALGQAAWDAVRIYRVNFAKAEVADVSEEIAIALYDKEISDGNPPWTSNHASFIREHIPASYRWGDGEQEWEPLPHKISETPTAQAAE